MNLDKLRECFPAEDIEWRIGRSGTKGDKPWAMALAYVTARAIQERLDEVFGVEGWQTDYTATPHGILCHLKVKIDNEWITKTDGAPETEFEAFKGGISGAFKRAASAGLGIGRYLYNLDETFVDCSPEKKVGYNYAKSRDGVFYWLTPDLPAWALPGGDGKPIVKLPKKESPKDERNVFAEMEQIFGKQVNEVNEYLRAIRWCTYEQSFLNLPADKITRILDNPDVFMQSVSRFIEKRDENGTA